MDFRVDVHQTDDLIGQMTYVLAGLVDELVTRCVRFVCVDQQFHFKGLSIAVDKLRDRRAQSRNGCLSIIDVPIDRVFFRVALIATTIASAIALAPSYIDALATSIPVNRAI